MEYVLVDTSVQFTLAGPVIAPGFPSVLVIAKDELQLEKKFPLEQLALPRTLMLPALQLSGRTVMVLEVPPLITVQPLGICHS
jgi:hypothetical protein